MQSASPQPKARSPLKRRQDRIRASSRSVTKDSGKGQSNKPVWEAYMPWTKSSIFEARRNFVMLALSPRSNVRRLCRQFNISPKTGYQTLDRYRAEGEKGLRDRSRAPRRRPSRSSKATELAILSVRADHPRWGGRRIASHLELLGAAVVPAPSTITAILARNGRLTPSPKQSAHDWLLAMLHNDCNVEEVPRSITSDPDHRILLRQLKFGPLGNRRRSISILADRKGLQTGAICRALNLSPQTYRRYIRLFGEGGAEALFAPRVSPLRKFDREAVKNAVFSLLHQPPSNFSINRTTWKMADLSRIMREAGEPAGEDVIRKILKQAGYRWRKARVVLTSNDPEFSDKLSRIQSILSELRTDEAFFSIDEFGPFAVKAQPGRGMVGPNETRLVPQWQRSKGCLILTAAIELSSNQITHFYSAKKNTDEMIHMMEMLLAQYGDRRKIYLSWDAASWHVSKKLFERIDEHNFYAGYKGPTIETAPLPARAQFLNVIESIFSGMSRAIIHNSDYPSVDEAKAAIDRYFSERNAHFRDHPRRAGGKVWGKEPAPSKFSEFNNCKDPRFR
jgi:transposase